MRQFIISVKITKVVSCIILFVYTSTASAQKVAQSRFKNGDKVCFVGNSITNNGEFYNFIYLYYATRFPKDKLTFVNCGISGDVASGMLKRLDKDILIHKPNWTVLMVGMNDVKRNLYTESASKKPGVELERKTALEVYREDTDKLVKLLKASSSVILEKPTIYDQTAHIKTEIAMGVNDALGLCAEMVQQLSEKYKTGLVNYHTIMNEVNKKIQKSDPSASVIGSDRIHPGSPGHLLMAYQFLKDTDCPKYVSKISVTKGQTVDSQNCRISNLKATKDEISFTCLENSLPFPVKEEAQSALGWVPFTQDLNQQILQLQNLSSGKYDLYIDDKLIKTYSTDELNEGVNLSMETATPQYQQALKVMALCTEYRKNENLLRSLKFVEYGQLSELKTTTDTSVIKQFLDERLKNYANSGHAAYYQTQFKNYLVNKPKQVQTERKLESLRSQIYTINKPVLHKFKLKRSPNEN